MEFGELQATVEQLQATVDYLVKKQNKLNNMQATVNYLKFKDMKTYFTFKPNNKKATWKLRNISIPVEVMNFNEKRTKALISFHNKKHKRVERIVKVDELNFV